LCSGYNSARGNRNWRIPRNGRKKRGLSRERPPGEPGTGYRLPHLGGARLRPRPASPGEGEASGRNRKSSPTPPLPSSRAERSDPAVVTTPDRARRRKPGAGIEGARGSTRRNDREAGPAPSLGRRALPVASRSDGLASQRSRPVRGLTPCLLGGASRGRHAKSRTTASRSPPSAGARRALLEFAWLPRIMAGKRTRGIWR
jgi:hypothetical protein